MNCQNCSHALSPSVQFCPKCGVPAAPAPYSPPSYQAQPSAWDASPAAAQPPRKSLVGKVLLIVGIVIVLLAGGVAAAVYYGYRYVEGKLKNSEPYVMAEAKLRQSDAVRERLGEIKKLGFPLGAFEEHTDGTGKAAFVIAVVGEKDSGQYMVALQRDNSVWRIASAIVKLADNDTINVLDPVEESGSYRDAETNENANTNSGNSNGAKDAKPKIISGGVLNGKAISKPEPVYPASAKSVKASGTVTVEIIVDEEGKVISANAVSGHPLLRASAVSAAKQARFSPTLLSGQPVKVKGTITYNFVLE